MWVISHHYSINLDNCNYYRAANSGESIADATVFKMNNGRIVMMTGDYDTVREQIERAYRTPGQRTVVLQY